MIKFLLGPTPQVGYIQIPRAGVWEMEGVRDN